MTRPSTSILRIFTLAAVGGLFAACSADGDGTIAPPAEAPDSSITSGDGSTPSNTSDAGTPSTSTCGNKKVETGEACDDGNTTSGDGCSATCTVESGGPEDLCSGGAVIALAKVDASTLYTGHVAGDTGGLFNHYSSTCGGGSGADAVYRIDPPMTGRATVKVTAGFPAIASIRTACDDAKTELTCSDAKDLEFPVFEGKPVFVFVDGYGGQKGEFSLDVDVQTAVCGNGKAEYPETCDDGNTTDGDGCSATCTFEDVASTSDCPGMGYRMKPGTASFAGDTSTLANGGGGASGCFNSGGGKNAIYAITPTVTGNLSLSLLSAYSNALLHVRRSCSTNATQADCAGAADALVPLKSSIAVFAEQTVYVFVDSGSTSAADSGLYVLDATLTAASCGNGKIDGNEECDDANTADGDGCSATCTAERDPATYACPGKALRLEGAAPGPRTMKLRGTTAPAAGESSPASKWSSCGVATAPDVVYAITSDIDGYLTAKVKGDFNTTLAIRSSCVTTGSDLVCAKAVTGNAQEILKAGVDKETTYYLIVDSSTASAAGAFELELEVVPSVCGNSVVEGGETCDDGAIADGDGCDATCHLETEKARDLCDTAPAITLEPIAGTDKYGATLVSGTTNLTKPSSPTHSLSPCSSTKPDAWFAITAPITGVVTARITSATFSPSIGIRTACAPSGTQKTCDDTQGFGGQEITFAMTAGETYRFGVSAHNSSVPAVGRFTASFELVPSGCGDTILNSGEACDDGNTTNGDGCSSTCTVETLAGADACPGHAVALTSGGGSDVRRAVLTVDTTSLPNKTGSACGGSGPEGIIALTSDIDGTLLVKATAGYPVLLYARTTCGDPTTEIPRASCTSSLGTFSAAIKKNTPYYLFVDGMNASSGVSKLAITVTP